MRTKLTLIFFSFLCIWQLAAQGPMPKLQVVTDYGKCLYGLKDQSGKQVWKTEFTALDDAEAKMDENVIHHFWIAEKNGLFGVLNDSGGILLPFQFDKVVLFRSNCFIAYKKNAVELYSLSGEKNYSGEDLEEIYPLKYGYVISKNGQAGFLDPHFKERIPIKFTHISPAALYEHLDSNWPEPSSRILRLSQGNNLGVYDLSRGLVVPCEYEHIEVDWASRCAESQAVYVAFRENSRYILNSDGTLIDSLELDEWPEFYHAPLDSCASKALTFCLVRRNTNYETGTYLVHIINLQTNERSGSFDEAYANGNRILCRSGKTWSVLDEHFEEIKHWTKWNASWHPAHTHFDEVIRQHHVPDWERESGTNLRNNQRVVIYSKPSKDQVYLNFGMYDYVLNKTIEPQYLRISEYEFEGKAVYWAYKLAKEYQKHEFDEMGPSYSQVDIYDDRLNLLRTFKNGEMPYAENLSGRDISDILFFRGINELYGMVNGRGEAVIPVKYKAYKWLIFQNRPNDPKPLTLYALEDEKGYVVFDQKGTQVISENHTDFNSMETFILATDILASDRSRTYAVFSKSGKKLLDNVSSYHVAKTLSGSNKCNYLKNNTHPELNLVFFARGKQLYYIQGEELKLADSETFQFTSNYLRLAHSIIVDRNGKLVDTKELKLKKWYAECPQQLDEVPLEGTAEKQQVKAKNKSLTYYWQRVVDQADNEEYWEVKNHSGVKLSSRKFDYPFNSVSESGRIYRVKGKYGLMREHFDEVLPPDYDYIYPNNGIYVAYKKADGLWTCFTSGGKASPDTYDAVSLQTWKKGGSRLVFKGRKVGILSDSATYLVPLTDSAEFVRKYDLVKLLQLDKRSAFELKTTYNLVSNAKPAEVYKQINNAQVVWYSYHYSTRNAIMRINPADEEFLDNFGDLYFRFHEEISKKDAMVTTPFYYTERIQSHSRSLSSYSDFSSYPQYRYTANNFKIVGGKLVPIKLKDLIPEPASMKQLDELLIKELNKKQYFGKDCVDMDAKIDRLKENVLLTSYSLVFYWPDLPLFQVELYFSQMKGILSSMIQKQVSEF